MAVSEGTDSADEVIKDSSTPPEQATGKLPTSGKKRSRNGCMNCRRKRRKCSETKPTCEGCQARSEKCEWGIKVTFRPENAQTVGDEYRSLFRSSNTSSKVFQIVDVTAEIARDYVTEVPSPEPFSESIDEVVTTLTSPPLQDFPPKAILDLPSPVFPLPEITSSHSLGVDFFDFTGSTFLSPHFSDSTFEDGIFVPGSQYQELHVELRSKLMDTARSTVPSRVQSCVPSRRASVDATAEALQMLHDGPVIGVTDIDEESRRLAQLSPAQEYVLWQNYISEVAPWLDKFDINRHFELVLPIWAKDVGHLKYSMLALSARQIELKEHKLELATSLALYQHAIHLLSPALAQRTTVVLASSVVLCVLEMLSCSPKAWRRHLDGCAALIQALGITGICGGPEQAIFWCFARMDVCGGLISLEQTLIPMSKWIGGGALAEDIRLLQAKDNCDTKANHIEYLLGRVVELLCRFGRWEQRHQDPNLVYTHKQYVSHWLELFDHIETWHRNRPQELKPILVIPAEHSDPPSTFPTVMYPNCPAISGNQLYHTAALLMLKHKPASLHLSTKPRSMLWHARQVCAISMSNSNHACWSNATQPIWIAGQLMSHASEHRAILELYERMEREMGWATKWRANDLLDHWGDLQS
ncbi:hypothetical protein B0A48_09307 [Cryoendolithus antarcticus]|uniref:Zn(2)-C6 fungal-type domain-containing protein n=1 Tax=Cryoendolithus antarcticus TaxID=1507870 RepID=A0A1V8T2A8_9PEZI|nr:hypothetical protein B0A48_09307 [Cryoendolithus antarcticus]